MLRHAVCMSALLCGITAADAYAQSGQQQLPPDFAQQQVPPSFPDETAQATPTTAADVQGQASSGEASEQAKELAPDQIPSQPEARKLVPATPMGAAAQGTQTGQAQNEPVLANDQAAVPNPVEDAAAQSAPAMPDILEKYTARNDELDEELGNDTASADALPEFDTPALEAGLQGTGHVVGADGTIQPEKTKEELQEEIRSEAYDAALTGMFPLDPKQVEGLLKRYDETQEATSKPPYEAPKPQISVQNISLDPGVMPPSLKTAVGNVTTLNILDATGAPWPVQDVTWAGDFEIVEPEEGGHIIRITPMSQFARGNIVIRMLTLKTPITMTLETSRDVVQYRVDARIPEYGPFASAPLMQGGKSLVAGSSELTSILDGVMPGGMSKLDVVGVDGRTTAYVMNGMTYVRTPLTLLSPAWQSSVSSADGMNVYALTNAPVLLLSDGGEFMRATLKEKEDLLDE